MRLAIETILVSFLLVALGASSAVGQAVPTAMTYQGKLTDTTGNPVPDGKYAVQFRLYTMETGGTAFWTSAVLSVTTSGGLFTTTLQPITPANLSEKTDVWLETWVGDPGVALAPRIKLSSAPFALRSGDLDLPFSGRYDTASSAFHVTNAGTGQAIRGSHSSNYGYFGSPDYGVFGYAKSGSYGVGGANFAGGSNGYLGGVSEGVHGVTTSSDFGVHGTSSSTGYAVYGESSGTGDAVRGYTTGASGSNAGSFEINNAASSSPAIYGTTNGSGESVKGYATGTGEAGYFQISNTGSATSALVGLSNGSGNALYAYNTGTGRGARIRTTTADNPSSALEATAAGTGNAGYFEATNAATTSPALYAATDATSNTSPAMYGIHSVSGNYGYVGGGMYALYANASGLSDYGVYAISSGDNGYGVYGYGSNSAAGSYNIGVWGRADGETGRGGYFYSTGATGRGVMGYASNSGNYVNYGGHFTANGDQGIGIYAQGGTSGYAAVLRGNVKIQDRSTGTTVMELGTGLDYAEGFDVADSERAQPGMVLVIDSSSPGKLTVSTKPYDRKVAGIVAGGKDLGSGVRLGAGQFDRDVALAGRVYCYVDATNAAVEPGDLLTTSGTPGYAMTVTDHERGQGAILGKAMESLPKGTKGQILVLVSLQ